MSAPEASTTNTTHNTGITTTNTGSQTDLATVALANVDAFQELGHLEDEHQPSTAVSAIDFSSLGGEESLDHSSS